MVQNFARDVARQQYLIMGRLMVIIIDEIVRQGVKMVKLISLEKISL